MTDRLTTWTNWSRRELRESRERIVELEKQLASEVRHEQCRDEYERLEAKLKSTEAALDAYSKERLCEWKYDDIHCYYDGECGSSFMGDGSLDENEYKFCPKCGNTIRLVEIKTDDRPPN